jgi:hypothetical protein
MISDAESDKNAKAALPTLKPIEAKLSAAEKRERQRLHVKRTYYRKLVRDPIFLSVQSFFSSFSFVWYDDISTGIDACAWHLRCVPLTAIDAGPSKRGGEA